MTIDLDANKIQIVISSATALGIAGYIIHDIWTGYKSFKKETYEKLSNKREKDECDEFRRLAERAEDKEDHK